MHLGPGGKLLNDPSAAGQAVLADLKDSLTDTQPAGSLVSWLVVWCSSQALVVLFWMGCSGWEWLGFVGGVASSWRAANQQPDKAHCTAANGP
jgi:hypothetical protein